MLFQHKLLCLTNPREARRRLASPPDMEPCPACAETGFGHLRSNDNVEQVAPKTLTKVASASQPSTSRYSLHA